MDTILNQVIGFAVGILSSWTFWYVLLQAKPKIAISPVIVFNPNKGSLLVKVRNQRRHQATDIQASLTLVERKPDGKLLTQQRAKLRADSIPVLAPIQNLKDPWNFPTTYIFATDEGRKIVDALLLKCDGERRIVFTLSATDALSGTKIVQMVTYQSQDVKYGRFGLDFQVEELQPVGLEPD